MAMMSLRSTKDPKIDRPQQICFGMCVYAYTHVRTHHIHIIIFEKKPNLCGLKRLFSSEEGILFLQRTQVYFPAPPSDGLQTSITLAVVCSTPSPGFYGMRTHMCIHTHTHQILKRNKCPHSKTFDPTPRRVQLFALLRPQLIG